MNDALMRLLLDADAGGGSGGSPGEPPKAEGPEKAEGTGKTGEEGKGLLDLGEGETGEDGKANAETPVTLESLKAPEGREWDAEASGAFLSLLNDPKIGKAELAQKLVDMHAAELARAEAAVAREEESIKAEWKAKALSDKEYGGEAFESNIRHINAGRDKLATPGAVEILKANGLDSHPDIVRMFYRAGKLVSEDGGSKVTEAGKTAPKEDSLVEMYRKSLEGA
jgi:hypothetical protein